MQIPIQERDSDGACEEEQAVEEGEAKEERDNAGGCGGGGRGRSFMDSGEGRLTWDDVQCQVSRLVKALESS